jgi:hypothetical protein
MVVVGSAIPSSAALPPAGGGARRRHAVGEARCNSCVRNFGTKNDRLKIRNAATSDARTKGGMSDLASKIWPTRTYGANSFVLTRNSYREELRRSDQVAHGGAHRRPTGAGNAQERLYRPVGPLLARPEPNLRRQPDRPATLGRSRRKAAAVP